MSDRSDDIKRTLQVADAIQRLSGQPGLEVLGVLRVLTQACRMGREGVVVGVLAGIILSHGITLDEMLDRLLAIPMSREAVFDATQALLGPATDVRMVVLSDAGSDKPADPLADLLDRARVGKGN